MIDPFGNNHCVLSYTISSYASGSGVVSTVGANRQTNTAARSHSLSFQNDGIPISISPLSVTFVFYRILL